MYVIKFYEFTLNCLKVEDVLLAHFISYSIKVWKEYVLIVFHFFISLKTRFNLKKSSKLINKQSLHTLLNSRLNRSLFKERAK